MFPYCRPSRPMSQLQSTQWYGFETDDKQVSKSQSVISQNYRPLTLKLKSCALQILAVNKISELYLESKIFFRNSLGLNPGTCKLVSHRKGGGIVTEPKWVCYWSQVIHIFSLLPQETDRTWCLTKHEESLHTAIEFMVNGKMEHATFVTVNPLTCKRVTCNIEIGNLITYLSLSSSGNIKPR